MTEWIIWLSVAIFLLGTFVLTAFNSALRRMQKRHSKKEIQELGRPFFYRPLHLFFLPEHEYEGIFFSSLCALNISRFFLVASLTLILMQYYSWLGQNHLAIILILLLVLFLTFTFSDYLPRALGSYYPKESVRFLAPLASLFLLFTFPFTYIFIRLSKVLWRSVTFDYLHEPLPEGKQELFEIIQEADLDEKLGDEDKKMIESVVSFQDRIAREVMVPRVDLFSLPADMSIREACRKLQSEGYSRTPVFSQTIDHIVGLLMYRDIMVKYMESEEKKDPKILDAPIETIVKPVLYTPETKKISHLLQEFRKKQMHLAIVVDEYGGTEGIVTIEDILEQIVGEIEDEYDQEEEQFIRLSDESLVVDARMSIHDLEEEAGIVIPQEGDYDTLGGYIFHMAGEIPTKGFLIKQDDFTLEVLKANDRMIQKVKVKKVKH